jgi:hypothetical protein
MTAWLTYPIAVPVAWSKRCAATWQDRQSESFVARTDCLIGATS